MIHSGDHRREQLKEEKDIKDTDPVTSYPSLWDDMTNPFLLVFYPDSDLLSSAVTCTNTGRSSLKIFHKILPTVTLNVAINQIEKDNLS